MGETVFASPPSVQRKSRELESEIGGLANDFLTLVADLPWAESSVFGVEGDLSVLRVLLCRVWSTFSLLLCGVYWFLRGVGPTFWAFAWGRPFVWSEVSCFSFTETISKTCLICFYPSASLGRRKWLTRRCPNLRDARDQLQITQKK